MTDSDYDRLSWPARIRLARLALPKATKTALAKELGTTVHTIVNWECGRCVPKQEIHRQRIKELCASGVAATGSKLNVNFLLGGIDANESILTRPLFSRDKSSTTLVLTAMAVKLAEHITHAVPNTVFVISLDTVINTYPSYINIHVAPTNIPEIRFMIRLSHIPAGITYTMELLVYNNDELASRYICDVSDASTLKVVGLLKKFIKKIKPDDKRRSRIRQY